MRNPDPGPSVHDQPALSNLHLHCQTVCAPAYVSLDNDGLRVAPATTAEVSAVLQAADADGVSVQPRGSGSKASWLDTLPASLVLETTRLNRVLEHTWQDMTCVVQAGCTWASLQTSLAQHGQLVALDPLWPARATVGGIVAVNDSGALRHRYGSLRDLIIGMTIVLPDGTIARSGGKVVKNVAGYDLHKLMTGAFGTLGIITEVNFRLHSIPRHTHTLSIASDDVHQLGGLMLTLLGSQLSIAAMQLRGESDGFHLDLELYAMPEVLAMQTAALAELARPLGLSSTHAGPEVWHVREPLFTHPDHFVCKATMLPSAIAAHAATVRAIGGSSVTQAVGVMIAAVPTGAAPDVLHWRTTLEAQGGSLTILQKPESVSIARHGVSPDSIAVMRQIKRQFDPHNTLNPGSFLGGI